jgi:hypothetical protein
VQKGGRTGCCSRRTFWRVDYCWSSRRLPGAAAVVERGKERSRAPISAHKASAWKGSDPSLQLTEDANPRLATTEATALSQLTVQVFCRFRVSYSCCSSSGQIYLAGCWYLICYCLSRGPFNFCIRVILGQQPLKRVLLLVVLANLVYCLDHISAGFTAGLIGYYIGNCLALLLLIIITVYYCVGYYSLYTSSLPIGYCSLELCEDYLLV